MGEKGIIGGGRKICDIKPEKINEPREKKIKSGVDNFICNCACRCKI